MTLFQELDQDFGLITESIGFEMGLSCFRSAVRLDGMDVGKVLTDSPLLGNNGMFSNQVPRR
jgi:hypothetical protein